MYMPEIGRWGVVDPMASKYYSISPYVYAANIPTILVDPNGMEIDLSEIMDRKERRAVRQALREHKSSGTYKNLYKELKKSDNRYVVRTENNAKSYAGASFEANTNMKTEMENETGGTSTFEMQNPNTADSFKPDEKGGVLTINTAWVDMESPNKIAGALVEEVVHAAQYENSVGKNENATTARGLPGTANTEFEAKTIVGQIQQESSRPLWTSRADAGANAFGRQAFQTKSINGYFGALSQWHRGAYQERRETTAQPTLLLKLIK
jgi:hypothetical protein